MNDDVTSQQNECPARNGRHCLHLRLCSPMNRRLALAETSFPPRQQPQKGCASVPILVFYQLPPRNETSVDGRKIDPGPVSGFLVNEISGVHAKNNLGISALDHTKRSEKISFVLASVSNNFSSSKKNWSLCMWVLSLSFSLPGLDIVSS
jgi:hypothetical protein